MKANFNFNYKEPIVCTAIHNGHIISNDILNNLGISEETRLMEEDPFTGFFTENCGNRIIVHTSRFEVDLNRSRSHAFYENPEDAWGLPVRKETTNLEVVLKSLLQYDEFYARTKHYLNMMKKKHKRFFVYDIHSYNHHRGGSDAPFDEQEKNPDIILGTNIVTGMNLDLVDAIEEKMREFDFFGKKIDVRQNVKFPGGNFSKWINTEFKDSACCIAIEFKKIFMDEWSSMLYPDVQRKLRELLESTFKLITDYMKS
ncbi:MAG: N-formylglutamate amidohydrolase [Candidatus Cloacimonetes bacterium]|nr:N-formylglutamate amidohydrolase [Candidatus Cloacimonadota bacterium]